MSDPYRSYQITPPFLEGGGDRPPLPPQYDIYSDVGHQSFKKPRMSELVPSSRMPIIYEAMPSNFGIPPWNNPNVGLYDQEMRWSTPAFNDTRQPLPSWRGNEFHEGRLAGSSNVSYGTSNKMKVCRQYHKWKRCTYGDQCRFRHGIPEKFKKNSGFSNQNYEAGKLAAGHVMDRRRGVDQLQVDRTGQTMIAPHSEIPKPECHRTRPCYPWQMTGHCPYGKICRFAHGETEVQNLGSCSVLEHGDVRGTSATTSATAEAGLRSSREVGTECKNPAPGMKQFFKSKEFSKVNGIYADWLEDVSFPHNSPYKDLIRN